MLEWLLYTGVILALAISLLNAWVAAHVESDTAKCVLLLEARIEWLERQVEGKYDYEKEGKS